MYLSYFGLKIHPFKITPNTRLFYDGGLRAEVLDALIYSIMDGDGIIKITGEVGSGKTMLSRMLEVRLPDTVEIVYLSHPSLSPDEILHAIARELNLDTHHYSNRLAVIHSLQNHLLQQHMNNRQTIVLIEEAQRMPLDTLEEIRLLSNLETHTSKLLQMILIGQPELDKKLADPEIRQLKERIIHSFTLRPLTSDEIGEYLLCRLNNAGFTGETPFNHSAVKRLHKYSAGLIRRVNVIADKALLAAYADDTKTVSAKHVTQAAKDSQIDPLILKEKTLIGAAIGLGAIFITLLGFLMG